MRLDSELEITDFWRKYGSPIGASRGRSSAGAGWPFGVVLCPRVSSCR